ncbi:MAG: FAD-dependent oxidoreductase [Peptococcaceae bacterium]|nr:FAD-dependent oxidoreductase [Peptococcaceae bacterium]
MAGSGPCGLTAAWYLAGRGHAVTVFEAQALPGGLLRYGIPAYRLPRETLDEEIGAIRERGVEIRTGTRVEAAGELLAGYDAVLVAAGAWRGLTAGLAASQPGVYDGLSFLAMINTGNPPSTGEKVVVGGGNTALDAARSAVRLGAREVLVIYRRPRAEMRADPAETAAAQQEGVTFQFMAAPTRIEAGRLVCSGVTADATGPARLVPVAGSEFAVAFDTLILAVGQEADAASIGLAANADGTARVEAETLATATRGLFAAGDAATGPSSVIRAIAQGRRVASSVDRFLGGDGSIEEPLALTERAVPAESSPRGTHRLVGDPLPIGRHPRAVVREAWRCLGCDLHAYEAVVQPAYCKDCGYCLAVCPYGVFVRGDAFNRAGYRPVTAAHSDHCVGCGRCLFICPDFAISIREVAGG